MYKKTVGKVLLLEALVILVTFYFTTASMGGFRTRFAYFFIDVPSFLSVLLLVVPALFVSGMARDFGNAFLIGKKEFRFAEMKRSLEAVKMVQRLVLCSSAFSAVIAIVFMLYNMSDPSSLGPCLAIVMLSVFYGIIMEFFLIPLSAHVQNHITDAMNVPEEPDFANAKMVLDDEDEED